MTRTVRIESEAAQELGAAIAWYEEQRPGLGDTFLNSVDEAVERLQEKPDGGTRVPGVSQDLPVFRVFVKKFPYALVYLRHTDFVAVIAVSHASRRPGYWRDRVR